MEAAEVSREFLAQQPMIFHAETKRSILVANDLFFGLARMFGMLKAHDETLRVHRNLRRSNGWKSGTLNLKPSNENCFPGNDTGDLDDRTRKAPIRGRH
jgi:hypothetical protein